MLRTAFGLLVILHGLVHLWPFVLSRGLLEYKPEMGWTGESWLLTGIAGDGATRAAASVLYAAATLTFVASGVGIIAEADWWRPLVVGSALLSGIVILVFWDGTGGQLVEKGLVGLLIDVGIILLVVVANWPRA